MALRTAICATLLLAAGPAAAEEIDCKDSIPRLEEQFKGAPQPALLLQLADCKRRVGDFAAAADLYAKFLTLYPKDAHAPEVQDLLARVEREERGQRKAARAAAPTPPTRSEPPARGALLAVLEFKNHLPAGDKRVEAGRFSDRVRGYAIENVRGLRVMKREKMLASIPEKLEVCEGHCEVETGRRIGADLVVSGDLRKAGFGYKLELRLNDVHSGDLLTSALAHGGSVDELDESVAQSAAALLQSIGKSAPAEPAPREDSSALGLLQKACDAGDVESCARAALALDRGSGAARNLARALALYRKACDAAEASACNNLGVHTLSGQGVERDPARAAVLFQKACEGGVGTACNQLGLALDARDPPRAAELYSEACAGEDPAGCSNLAVDLLDGLGVPRDEKRAADLFARSCSGGFALACWQAALGYEQGRGVSRDLAHASSLRERACALGLKESCRR
jgi:TPR repeat protein